MNDASEESTTIEFLSHEEYVSLAKMAIKRYNRQRGEKLIKYLTNEININFVASYIALGDWKFNKNKGTSRSTNRFSYGVYGIKKLAQERKEMFNSGESQLSYETGYTIKKSHSLTEFEEIIDCLSEKSKEIIRFRYLDRMTLKEIADIKGLSKERIRQLLNDIYRTIRVNYGKDDVANHRKRKR